MTYKDNENKRTIRTKNKYNTNSKMITYARKKDIKVHRRLLKNNNLNS